MDGEQFINPALNGPTFLSIDQAKGSLLERPAAPKTDTSAAALEAGQQPRPAPAERPVPQPQQEQGTEAGAETPAGDDDTEQPAEGEEEEPALPAVEPPAFWKKAAKEFFASLPREVQETIVEEVSEGKRSTNAAIQKAAEERKAFEAERQAVQTQRQTYGQQLDMLLPLLHQELMGEFSDVKNVADFARLKAENPARASAYEGRMALINAAAQQRQIIAFHEQAQAEEARKTRLADAEKRLVETFPEWKDTARGQKEIGEIRTYLAETYDVPQEHLSGLTEPYQFQVVRKAMLYDKAQKARAEAVERPAPRSVQVPGRGKVASDRAKDQREAIFKRLEQTGDLRGAAAAGLLRIP